MFRHYTWMSIVLCIFLTQPLLAGDGVVVYVTADVAGRDADGSIGKPYGSIAQALTKVFGENGGTIYLRGGIYRDTVTLAPVANAGPLLLAATPGEKVIFEGGSPVDEWSLDEATGLYRLRMNDIAPAYSSAKEWVDIWEDSERVRYRIQLDAAGVKAYPGSACLLDPKTALVNPRDGKSPVEVTLWRNRLGNGLDIQRAGVTVRGLTFQNFLGAAQARAITVRGDRGVIEDCTFINSMRGISGSGNGLQVERCLFQEVAQGVAFTGIGLTVRDCVIEGATGAFAFRGINSHLRTGIRIYHPAEEATVEHCITRGFWAGIFIKTSPPLDRAKARPFIVRHNTFLDGIRWGGGQSLAEYRLNLIGPDEEGLNTLVALPASGATVSDNYVFNGRNAREEKDGNLSGPNPFVNSVAGDLSIRDGVVVPEEAGMRAGAKVRSVKWHSSFSHVSEAVVEPEDELKLEGPVIVSSSSVGALMTAQVSRTVSGILYYRESGADAWEARRGVDATLPNEAGEETSGYRLAFSLADGRLKADNDYEYYIELSDGHQRKLKTEAASVKTEGEPRKWYVSVSAEEGGSGSDAEPLSTLQEAIDRALPGDEIVLGEGVHVAPAVMTQSGRNGAPIRISGAGMRKTVIDGGKIPQVLLDLRRVAWVEISGIQFRWFVQAGIRAEESREIQISECLFQNSSDGANSGIGVELKHATDTTIVRSVFTRLTYGIVATESPRLTIRDNTAFLNLYSSVMLLNSCRDSELTGNSFTFTGNASLRISEADEAAFRSLNIDYNNYAARLGPLTAAAIRAYTAAGVAVPTLGPPITPSMHYQLGSRGQSKRIIDARVGGAASVRHFRLDDWKESSGKDKHSIFADPLYRDPLNGDFSLLPDSPNRLSDGRVIGAFGLLEL